MGKIDILRAHNLLRRKFTVVCRKIAPFCPHTLLTHDASGSHSSDTDAAAAADDDVHACIYVRAYLYLPEKEMTCNKTQYVRWTEKPGCN